MYPVKTNQGRFSFRSLLPVTWRGRWALGLGMAALLFLSAVGYGAFSVWVEDRFPSSDSARSLAPRLQKAFTKPVANALSAWVEYRLHRRMEARYMNTGLTIEETIARFLDESFNPADRRILAYSLARKGTPEAMAALAHRLRTARSIDKAFMAQLIGNTGNPRAKELLWPLLQDSDQRVATAAIRGLGAIGGPDVSERLGLLVADSTQSEAMRIDAAKGLADMGSPAERDILTKALTGEKNSEVGKEILESLGRLPYPLVAQAIEEYLSRPDAPEEMRVAAVEALAHSTVEAVSFLLKVAEHDGDPEVRAGAAWALSFQGPDDYLGPTLVDLAERENDPDVRRRLYEAMLSQSGIALERLLAIVSAETDISARVAGFNALAATINKNPSASSAVIFDRQIVPELLRIATSDNNLNIRMRAVFALRRSHTTSAQNALAVIAGIPTRQIADAARHGLSFTVK